MTDHDDLRAAVERLADEHRRWGGTFPRCKGCGREWPCLPRRVADAWLADHPAAERQGGVKRWISDREYVIEPDDESAAAHQPSDYVPEPPDWVACACGLDCDPRDPDHLGHRAEHPAPERDCNGNALGSSCECATASECPTTPEPPSGGEVTADELARAIWHTSRADESTISATGANHVAAAILARYDVRSKP